jgi:hypothetical protein
MRRRSVEPAGGSARAYPRMGLASLTLTVTAPLVGLQLAGNPSRSTFEFGLEAIWAVSVQVPPDMRAAPALEAVSDRAPQGRARPHGTIDDAAAFERHSRCGVAAASHTIIAMRWR